MVGREAVIEKLTWKVLLENKVSKETGSGETEKLLLSLGNTGLVRKKKNHQVSFKFHAMVRKNFLISLR